MRWQGRRQRAMSGNGTERGWEFGGRPGSQAGWWNGLRIWPTVSARSRVFRIQGAADQGDGGFGPLGDGRVQGRELGLGDVQAAGRDGRAQLDQDGAQMNLDREQVAGPAAGHDGD